jgi:GxxExxY protein
MNNKIIYEKESYDIVGAAMEVHRQLGPGFLEAVYHEALCLEFANRNIPFENEVELPINYKGTTLIKKYIADIICYDKIILELKAVSEITSVHQAQVFNYLKATGFKLGILFNFSEESLYYQRIVKEKPG